MAALWEQKAAKKRAERDAAIPAAWRVSPDLFKLLKMPLETNRNDLIGLDIVRKSGILTARELEITEKYDVAGLLAALASGALSSVEVATAFSKRAAIAQQLCGCLTEVFFDRALERARLLDDMRSRGQLAGPFHGLPISVKDSFQVAGTDATLGIVSFLDLPSSTSNSHIIDVLLALGAVLYVKTNVPQTLMSADSHNNVFGRVLNPRNTMLGAGGSSGGEAALIALRGSLLGVGTDLAGSIRIPPLCCGLYGFKPTSDRIPYGGQRSCFIPGLFPIVPCAGPLASDVDALGIFTKTVLDARPALLDSTALDVPWREVRGTIPAKLRLGVLVEDPLFPWHPPVRDAIREACALLRASGHEMVELTAEEGRVADAVETAFSFFALDKSGERAIRAGGEPAVPSLIRLAEDIRNMDWHFLTDLRGVEGIERLAALNVKRDEIMQDWLNTWNTHRLDAVISPGAQGTAVEHDMYSNIPYTALQNVLDYPASIIPFGRASGTGTFEKKRGQGGPPYNADLTKGAPRVLQIFTPRMRDEECIAITKMIDEVLRAV